MSPFVCVCVFVVVEQLYLPGISCSQKPLWHQSPSDDPPKGAALQRILRGEDTCDLNTKSGREETCRLSPLTRTGSYSVGVISPRRRLSSGQDGGPGSEAPNAPLMN